MFRNLVMTFAMAVIAPALASTVQAQDGWTEKASPHSVAATTEKLKMAVEKAGAKVFAVVDHAAGATSIGEELPPTTLIVFGNPKIGTPLIQSNQLVAYDLPIRVLIWDDNGSTKLGYTAPAALAAEYNINDAEKPVAMMSGAVDKLTSAAIAP